jgi:hypothetical protein
MPERGHHYGPETSSLDNDTYGDPFILEPESCHRGVSSVDAEGVKDRLDPHPHPPETTATVLDQAGQTARQIADQLGQAKLSITQDTTSPANPAAADALEYAFDDPQACCERRTVPVLCREPRPVAPGLIQGVRFDHQVGAGPVCRSAEDPGLLKLGPVTVPIKHQQLRQI